MDKQQDADLEKDPEAIDPGWDRATDGSIDDDRPPLFDDHDDDLFDEHASADGDFEYDPDGAFLD